MVYRVQFITSGRTMTLSLQPGSVFSRFSQDEVISRMKYPSRTYSANEINVARQVLAKYPDATEIEFIQNNSNSSGNGSGAGVLAVLLILAFILCLVFAQTIIALGVYGHFLLKRFYKPVLNDAKFRKFRKPYAIFGFIWLIICAAMIVVGILVSDVAILLQIGIYALVIGNVIFFIIGGIVRGKTYKRIEKEAKFQSSIQQVKPSSNLTPSQFNSDEENDDKEEKASTKKDSSVAYSAPVKPIVIEPNIEVEPLLVRTEIFIEDGEYEKADAYLEAILNKEPKNSQAYLLKLIIELQLHSVDELKNCDKPFTENKNFKRAYDFGDEKQKQKLDAILNSISSKKEDERCSKIYSEAESLKSRKQYKAAREEFLKIPEYKDAKEQAEECTFLKNKETYDFAISRKNDKDYKRAITIFESIIEFEDSKQQIEDCHKQALNDVYERAMKEKQSRNYRNAISTFSSIIDYKDSKAQIDGCKELINADIYNRAIEDKNKQKYENAIKTFSSIPEYKDSKEQIDDCKELINADIYNRGIEDKNNQKYSSAINCFSSILEYKDSKEQIEECKELKNESIYAVCVFKGGLSSANIKMIEAACSRLETIKDYKDSKQLIITYREYINNYEEAKKKKKKKISLIATCTTLGLVTSLLLTFLVFVPLGKQEKAYRLIDSKHYDDAQAFVIKNQGINDSENMLEMIKAGRSFESGNYESGIDFVYDIGGTVNVQYDANGGNATKNSETIKKTLYHIDNNVTREGYTFLGWVLNNYSLKSKKHQAFIELIANWYADLNNLSITSDNIYKGTVDVTYGNGFSDEFIEVIAKPAEDCVFVGWYHGEEFLSGETTYSFTMPTHDYSLVAHFLTKAEIAWSNPVLSDDGQSITYGIYPQKHVTDQTIIDSLEALGNSDANGWYNLNDNYYVKKTIRTLYNRPVFDDGSEIEFGEYWFKCEPIIWDVVSNNNNELLLFSSILLDACCFYHSSENRTIDGKTIYPNNYEHSDLREWLNNDFYESAFRNGDEYVKTTYVDNSRKTTGYNDNPCACNDTMDKVFLPSYVDLTERTSPFFTNKILNKSEATEWARACGAFTTNGTKASKYWTRSSFHYPGLTTYHEVYLFGNYSIEGAYYEHGCVRPCITIGVASSI